jgi:hypothetical protein
MRRVVTVRSQALGDDRRQGIVDEKFHASTSGKDRSRTACAA